MNISIILIVAIGSNLFALDTSNSVQGNSAQLTFNINVQSPQASQEAAPATAAAQDFLEKMHNIEWQKMIAMQWEKYRIPFLVMTLTSGYGYVWYQLYQARKFLTNPEAWCCWKNHIEIDRFITLSHDELNRELLIDIQERYINSVNPTDFVLPLASFLPVVEKEKEILEFYVWWGTKIIASHAQWFFPVDKNCVDAAREALRRLKFIKNLFVVWWAQHNSQGSFSKS